MHPTQSPSRWVINFFDWPLNPDYDSQQKKPKGKPYASDYPDCLTILEELVKPERDKNNRKSYRDYWWHYAEKRPALYETIKESDRVLVIAATSRTVAFAFEATNIVYSHATIVLTFDDYASFAILQSVFHEFWAREYASSMKGDLRYTPSDILETFPFPDAFNKEFNPKNQAKVSKLEEIGEQYYTMRQQIMSKNQEGLTKTYNRFHNPKEIDADIFKLRQLHTEMDKAVALAYGWEDLELNHDFHETKQGLRYTISEEARREILDRLLELNHAIYAAELEQGLHEKGKKKASKTSKKSSKKPKNTRQGELDFGL